MTTQRKNETREAYLVRASADKRLERLMNPGRNADYQKQRYAENAEWDKFQTSLSKYNLTLDQYHSILERQDFCCAICCAEDVERVTTSGRRFRLLGIDHDHKTNKVRGLLCPGCNAVLGCAHDNVGVLHNSIQYLITVR